MPKLSGIFEQFKNLDQIPTENITRWLKSQPPHTIENFLANRILYPQVVPMSAQDVETELAILREVLVGQRNFVTGKKIIIPEELMSRYPQERLVGIFIDTFKPQGVFHFIKGQEAIGTFIKVDLGDLKEIDFLVENKRVKVKKGQLIIVPCQSHCHINFKSERAVIEDKKEGPLEMLGGKVGLVFDGR